MYVGSAVDWADADCVSADGLAVGWSNGESGCPPAAVVVGFSLLAPCTVMLRVGVGDAAPELRVEFANGCNGCNGCNEFRRAASAYVGRVSEFAETARVSADGLALGRSTSAFGCPPATGRVGGVNVPGMPIRSWELRPVYTGFPDVDPAAAAELVVADLAGAGNDGSASVLRVTSRIRTAGLAVAGFRAAYPAADGCCSFSSSAFLTDVRTPASLTS